MDHVSVSTTDGESAGRSSQYKVARKPKHSVLTSPPIQPCTGSGGVHLILIHCAIRLSNRLEQESQRRGNIQIVVQCLFKSSRWALGVGRWALGVFLFRDFVKPGEPFINSA